MNNELEANKKHFSKSYNQQLILLSQTAGETDHEEKVAATTDETSYELLTLQEGFLSLFLGLRVRHIARFASVVLGRVRARFLAL